MSGDEALKFVGTFSGVSIGVDLSGEWWAVANGQRRCLRLSPAAGLVLLETNRREFQAAIDAVSASRSFPFPELLYTALTSGLGFWAERGIHWLIPSDSKNALVAEGISELASAKWATQELRRRAQMLRLTFPRDGQP